MSQVCEICGKHPVAGPRLKRDNCTNAKARFCGLFCVQEYFEYQSITAPALKRVYLMFVSQSWERTIS